MRAQLHEAFTLVEMLVVIAMTATLSAVAVPLLHHADGRTTAAQLAALVHEARLQAMGGVPTAVVVTPGDVGATIALKQETCEGPVMQQLTVPPGMAVQSTLRRGVIWRPDGSGRTCAGSGIYGGTVTLHGRETWKVVLSSVGRVRLAHVDR